MQDLKVALIQANLVWEDAKQNRKNFDDKIEAISENVDLIVLPEMFTTGFTMNASSVAETMDGQSITWLKKWAKAKDTAITGSLIIKEGEDYYNRLVFVFPSGALKIYDKRHTFTLAGEDKIYTAGTKKILVDYKGWKICPLICYDLRFPVWARNTENYHVLIYVANWPKPRTTAWDALLKARAIENMSYCIGVNRVGLDATKHEYSGHSVVINALGDTISSIEPETEQTHVVLLSAEHVQKTREKLQFLADSDSFTIN
tara:strand:- start:248283 stop:249059 length:777 start_codon:yes stop_codon:yes gene_type:complete